MKVSIFEYMDVCLFLQEIYKSRKESDPAFSYTEWAHQLKLSNKTLLRLMVQGKRQISEKSRLAFKENLNFQVHEAEYFDVLVDYCQSKTPQQRQLAGSKLMQVHRKHHFQPQVVSADSDVVTDAYGPIVLCLVSSWGKPVSLQEVSIFLNLPNERCAAVLAQLVNSGMVERDGEMFTPCQNMFRVPDSFSSEKLRAYYSYWLQQSAAAMNLPVDLRRFRSLQIALSPEEFSKVTAEFNEFVVGLLSRYEHNTLDSRSLYLMNTVLFPVGKLPVLDV